MAAVAAGGAFAVGRATAHDQGLLAGDVSSVPVPDGQKVVALSFDDGPSARYTPTVVRLLAAHRDHATFFLVGRSVVANGDLVRAELADGDEVGNHTWDHPDLRHLSATAVLHELMVRNGDAAKPIWVTEFGWTSDRVHPDFAWARVSEAEKAAYLVQAFEWARAHWDPWIGPMMVWNMPDPAWGPQDEMYWWSISNPDGSPRPAFLALKAARQNGTLP